jgi:dTDP-glucose 4,6-dehydratase
VNRYGASGGTSRALVTGGAGFLGSLLCERLLAEGYRVVCIDNLSTGTRENVAHLEEDPAFEYVEQDVTLLLRIGGRLDEIYHFASPASPKDFGRIPIRILKAGSLGTQNALDLALDRGARFVLASSSEVYGDPLVHPQHEDYRGNSARPAQGASTTRPNATPRPSQWLTTGNTAWTHA